MKRSTYIAILFVLASSAYGNKPAETATENPPTPVPKIDIISPTEGAMLDAKAKNKLDYNITLGSDGDHIHIYVDNQLVAMLHQIKGSYSFDYLEQGKREICIRLVSKGHSSIGVERCVTVMVE